MVTGTRHSVTRYAHFRSCYFLSVRSVAFRNT